MSITPIISSATGLTPLSGTAPSIAEVVTAGAGSVAAQVIGRIGEVFEAAAGAQGNGAEVSPYDLQSLADTLGRSMSATPVEVVDLERGLESLAGAVAADMVALADGRTLDRVEEALTSLSGDTMPATPSAVAQRLEQLAADFAAAR